MTATSSCPACEIGPFLRNHYFTGKLLLERDFTDEQRYLIEKLRHHHQRLHGWGVVCGLKVKQHGQPDCRSRFVCVEPGTAIDCCGHEIVVRDEDCLDLLGIPALKDLWDRKDTKDTKHRLQICLRYVECPTEEIPVLYDDCAGDGGQCAPNRILESYALDVLVDPPEPPETFHAPKLEWKNSLPILADVSRVALDDAGHRVYLLAGGTVYQQATEPPALVGSLALGATGLDIAVSRAGDFVFAAAAATTTSPGTKPRRLIVIKTADMSEVRHLDIPESVGSDIRLAVASDGRLIALAATPSTGKATLWTEAELTGTPDPPAKTPTDLGAANLQSLAVSSDARHAYAVGPDTTNIKNLGLTPATPVSDIAILPTTPPAKPAAIAVARSTGPDRLVIADQSALHLVELSPLTRKSVPLPHAAVALTVAPGGRWAYVLLHDATNNKDFVQTVDLHRLQQGLPVALPPLLPVGAGSRQLVLSGSGATLYVPYGGDPANGGVAKIEISEQACEEILWRHLDGCPRCDTPNCVTLATIEGWRVGDQIEDIEDPPSDPAADAAAHIVRIDNRRGRPLLPSTQTLAELIECLLEQGPGGAGAQGPPGAQGTQGPQGKDGPQGPAGPGLETDLTRIVQLSWKHNTHGNPFVSIRRRGIGAAEVRVPGIAIVFSRGVRVFDAGPPVQILIDAKHVFEVLTRDPQNDGLLLCRCPVRGQVIPFTWEPRVDPNTTPISWTNDTLIATPGPVAQGIAFVFDDETLKLLNQQDDVWVRLRCDFVVDVDGRAVDGEFVRAELPTGNRPDRLGARPPGPLGIQGGLFESWFWVRPSTGQNPGPGIVNPGIVNPGVVNPGLLNVNVANRTALEGVPAINRSLSTRILNARKADGPFQDLEDFRSRLNLTEEQWSALRDQITAEQGEE